MSISITSKTNTSPSPNPKPSTTHTQHFPTQHTHTQPNDRGSMKPVIELTLCLFHYFENLCFILIHLLLLALFCERGGIGFSLLCFQCFVVCTLLSLYTPHGLMGSCMGCCCCLGAQHSQGGWWWPVPVWVKVLIGYPGSHWMERLFFWSARKRVGGKGNGFVF